MPKKDHIREKLQKEFPEEKLMMQISAVQDEELMRECIETYLKNYASPCKQIAIETGTYHGVSTALLAQYFDKVITFDIRTGYYKDEDIKWTIWKFLGVDKKIEFHLIKNDEEKAQILKNLNYTFAFVDGQHIGGVEIDYNLLNGCNNLLFHDYVPGLPENNMRTHIVKFVDTLGDNIVLRRPPFALWIRR